MNFFRRGIYNMATMIDQKNKNNEGDRLFWDYCKTLLPKDVIVYFNHEVNGKEFDFCLFIENKGILIVEVKSWTSDQIVLKAKDDIFIKASNASFKSPKTQANLYRYHLKNIIQDKFHINPLVLSMACYPKMTKREYYNVRLDIASEVEWTLLKDDFENENTFYGKICSLFDSNMSIPHDDFTYKRMVEIRGMWEPDISINTVSDLNETINYYSKLTIFNNQLTDLDVDELIQKYRCGVKQIVFVNYQQDLDKIRKSLNEFLRIHNLNANDGNLSLGFEKEIENNINIFNFQVFLCKNKCYLGNNKIEIIDGIVNNYFDLLEKLSKETPFNFNQYQVEHAPINKHILVEAGAGTGKTYSMVSRVAFLCNNSISRISNISKGLAMVTFTNDAANNMKKRLKKMFENYFLLTKNVVYLDHIENIDCSSISTIHKFCIEALRNSSYYTGLGTNFKISSNEKLRKTIYEKHIDLFFKELQEENKNFINELPIPVYELKKKTLQLVDKLITKSIDINSISPSDFGILIKNNVPFFNELLKKAVFKAEQEYLDTMKLDNLMDLKESIILLNKVLKTNENLLERLKIKYFFIDEFQDTDDVQIELFKRIKKSIESNNNVCHVFVVGDIKQSIYRFRGAKLSAFEEIKKMDVNEWCHYYLNTNYRTDLRLLSIFDIYFTKFGKDKYLPYTEKDRLRGIKSFDYVDNLFECVKVHGREQDQFFDTLFSVLNNQIKLLSGYSYMHPNLSKEKRTIAILVRSNWQVENIVREAAKRKIEVEVKSGGDLYQLESTHDLYKLINALLNYKNPVFLIDFIESNYTDLKLDYYSLYGLNENEKIVSITKVLDDFFRIRMGKNWIEVVKMALTNPVLYVLRKIYESLQPWQNYNVSYSRQREYMENYEYLLEKITEFFQIDTLTINEVKNYLEIKILTKEKELSRKSETEDKKIHVICTTIHKSKGLEYGTVFMPYTFDNIEDMKKNKVEASYSKSELSYYVKFENEIEEYNSNYNYQQEIEEQIEEEVRILYVALTRAIYNFVWFFNLDSNSTMSWGSLMEEIYDD